MKGFKGVPGSEMGFGGEDSKSRTLALGTDLVVSELLNELRPGYHCSDQRYSSPTFNRTAKLKELLFLMSPTQPSLFSKQNTITGRRSRFDKHW